MGDYKNDPQTTYALLDMGALTNPQYWWWKGVTDGGGPGGMDHFDTAPANWCLRVEAVNPDDPDDEDETGQFPPVVKEIRHADVVRVIDEILSGKYNDENQGVGRSTRKHCQKLVDDPEYGYLAWDHWLCDELIQVIVYDGVVF
jgi:hypothetical protein